MSHNSELSNVFLEMSTIYKFLGDKDRFRASAYLKASRIIQSLPEDVSYYLKRGTLEEIPGIGESISDKIQEFLQTGYIKKLEILRRKVPHELLEIMNIKGFGPKIVKTLYSKLKITTKAELIESLNNGNVAKLPGFGPVRIANIMNGLKIHKSVEQRLLLWDASKLAEKIVEWMKKIPGITRVEVAGSLRRKKETIGDIDILVEGRPDDRNKIIGHFTKATFAQKILTKGETKASIIMAKTGCQVDLRIINPGEWGSGLQYFTGSKEHNIRLRSIARKKGYKINEYGLFKLNNNKKAGGSTEEEIYNMLGYAWIPPELRENNGEIELSAKNQLPDLVTIKDIRGDLHVHSNWSDGLHSIEELARYAKNEMKYDYLVITDHSKTLKIAHGLSESRILEQVKKIGEINKKLNVPFIKTGLEVDILPNGKLDISDDILSQLDWVIASVHQKLTTNIIERITMACKNPYVSCIGHPVGRLIGKRAGYEGNWTDIFTIAKKTNTCLEINAQPQRMDLPDILIRKAVEMGVQLVITTDTHTLNEFRLMEMGVSMARRGWCSKEHILNSKSWKHIDKFVRRKRM